MIKQTIIIAALFVSSTPEIKLCNRQCPNHSKDVIIEIGDVTEMPKYYEGLENGDILLCNGIAEGFTNHNTGEVFCDGTNHECSIGNNNCGSDGECYVCY